MTTMTDTMCSPAAEAEKTSRIHPLATLILVGFGMVEGLFMGWLIWG